MTKTIIHIMRHGEVENPEGILYGRLPNYSLSNLGKKMAQMVADTFIALEESNISKVIASPLLRAQQTALPTAKAFNLDIESDSCLIEAGNYFEGVPVNKNRKILFHPKFWKYYLNPFRPSWGEPYKNIAERMLKAVHKAHKENIGKQILLVSHQLPIWCLRRKLEGKKLAHLPNKRQCSLASITTLIFEDNKLIDIVYWEPASSLLEQAKDVTPGTSKASIN